MAKKGRRCGKRNRRHSPYRGPFSSSPDIHITRDQSRINIPIPMLLAQDLAGAKGRAVLGTAFTIRVIAFVSIAPTDHAVSVTGPNVT
jgi:hypothetical protein